MHATLQKYIVCFKRRPGQSQFALGATMHKYVLVLRRDLARASLYIARHNKNYKFWGLRRDLARASLYCAPRHASTFWGLKRDLARAS